MKALTVRQPHALQIARGRKRVENRTWSTTYRGPLLIHAGLSRVEFGIQGGGPAIKDPPETSFGAIVARVELVDVVRLADLQAELARSPRKLPPLAWVVGHEFTAGPFCWILANPVRLEPTLVRGKQGLWEYAGEVAPLTGATLAERRINDEEGRGLG